MSRPTLLARSFVGRQVDVDDLIDTQDVARLLGLAQRNTVSEYQARYDDMPRPVIDLGRGRSKLRLRPEIETWSRKRAFLQTGRTRPLTLFSERMTGRIVLGGSRS